MNDNVFALVQKTKGDKAMLQPTFTETQRKEIKAIQALLREAITVLDEEPEMAAWRVADAGGLLRTFLEKEASPNLIGLHSETGRGFVLSRNFEQMLAALQRVAAEEVTVG